jgi:hypothetical protein
MKGEFDYNEIDNALHELRQMTIISLRMRESISEATHLHNPEVFEALSFSLHNILERVDNLRTELLGEEDPEEHSAEEPATVGQTGADERARSGRGCN